MIQLSYSPAPFIADEDNISVFILAIHGFCDYVSLGVPVKCLQPSLSLCEYS